MNYKGFLINPVKESPGVYGIATEGRGGKIPLILSGHYTTRSLAMKDIDTYMEIKEKVNAKERIEGGSK